MGGIGLAPLATQSGVSLAASTDGTLDTTFNEGQTGANGTIRSIAFTADEKIYIAGDFTSYNGFAVGGIARLNPNGAPDLTFNQGQAGFAKTSGLSIRSISLAADGDIYATGSFTSYNGTTFALNNVVRINPDGSLDTGFVAPRFESINFTTQQVGLAFVKNIGDVVFVSGGFEQIYEDPATSTTSYAKGLVALTTTGAVEANFGRDVQLAYGLSTSSLYDIVKVANSTDYYLHGSFMSLSNQTAINFGRMKSDGTRNLDYANSGSLPAVGPNNAVTGMTVQADGKILLGGNFSTFNGSSTAKGLVRVNPDGTLDTSFTSPASSLIAVSLAVDATGRIYVAGGIGTGFGTSTSRAIVRLKSDGTLDSGFDLPLAPTGYDNEVAISPTGKLFIYGNITKLGDTTIPRLARLTVSSPDTAPAPTTTTTAPAPNTGTVTTSAPGQPTNIKAKITGTKAKVSWSAPASGGAPDSYVAIAYPVSASAASVTKNAAANLSCSVSAPATSCTIIGLKPGTKYGFSVTASNSAGGSPTAAVAKPVLVPVAKASSTKELPATGSSDQAWLLFASGLVLLAGGLVVRRSRMS